MLLDGLRPSTGFLNIAHSAVSPSAGRAPAYIGFSAISPAPRSARRLSLALPLCESDSTASGRRKHEGGRVPKVRVYELAREFGVESTDVLKALQQCGEFVRSASSVVEPVVVLKLRDYYGSGGMRDEQSPGSQARSLTAEAARIFGVSTNDPRLASIRKRGHRARDSAPPLRPLVPASRWPHAGRAQQTPTIRTGPAARSSRRSAGVPRCWFGATPGCHRRAMYSTRHPAQKHVHPRGRDDGRGASARWRVRRLRCCSSPRALTSTSEDRPSSSLGHLGGWHVRKAPPPLTAPWPARTL
jgi:hypothetical protein